MTDTTPQKMISGWGNYPVVAAQCAPLRGDRLPVDAPHYIARGLGRSYGDSGLAAQVVDATTFNRMLAFDETRGILTCEAGVSLAEILDVFVPRGWFLPVTPGTKYVTVGGAVAADVHGKNHHVAGSFGDHVVWLDLLLPDGTVTRCTSDDGTDLLLLTRGGMGLTGIILRVAFRLQPVTSAYIHQTTARYGNLDAIMDAFEAAADVTYSVAWIDGLATGRKLGRSVLFTGEHATPDQLSAKQAAAPLQLRAKRKLSVPFPFPGITLNPLTVRAFNICYYGLAPGRPKTGIIDYDTFFYPLDHILHWNRLYGRRGFTQYQFVLPPEAGRDGMRTILHRIARSGEGSFLSVLKLFGDQQGVLSFPRRGYTLALDFPIRKTTFALLDELDRMVLDHGGRVYLAKDVRMSGASFRAGYDGAQTFLDAKARLDPEGRLQSLQSQRLGVDS